MQVKSNDGKFIRLSGRIGDFIFRTFKSGKIFATYAPTGTRVKPDAIPIHFRKQMKDLNLQIINDHERDNQKAS